MNAKMMLPGRLLVAPIPGENPAVAPFASRRVSRRTGRFDLHAISRPARVFTGDFYVAHTDRSGLRIALGDVAGKGLGAAIVMAMIQEELERWRSESGVGEGNPEATLFRLQELLKPLLPDNRFATAVIAHLGRDGSLALANAGHCAPLIARADGSLESIAATGPVLGILDRPRWTSVRTRLGCGDALLLYSDGLSETRSPQGLDFGEVLAPAFAGLTRETGAGARAIAEGLFGEAGRHAEGKAEDDLTLVVVRRA